MPIPEPLPLSFQELCILEDQTILLEARQSAGGSGSSSSETNITSPVTEVASSLAPMSLTTAGSGGLERAGGSYYTDTSTPASGAEHGLAGLHTPPPPLPTSRSHQSPHYLPETASDSRARGHGNAA